MVTMSESVQRGQAIFLTGPPLAGKTSTAMAWAARRPQITAPLDWDELHNLLFRGDRLRAAIDVSDRYRFAARIAAATAARVLESGHDCVITGARVPARPSDPPEWRGHWDDLDRLDPITIVLLPSLDARLERRRRDPGRVASYSEDQVRESHRYGWERWYDAPRARVLDTSDQSPEEVLDSVEDAAAEMTGQGRSGRQPRSDSAIG